MNERPDSTTGNFPGFALDASQKDRNSHVTHASKSTADFQENRNSNLNESAAFGSDGIQNESRNDSSRFEDDEEVDEDGTGSMGFGI